MQPMFCITLTIGFLIARHTCRFVMISSSYLYLFQNNYHIIKIIRWYKVWSIILCKFESILRTISLSSKIRRPYIESIALYTGHFFLFKNKNLYLRNVARATMGDKSVETLGSEIQFWSVLVTFSSLPPKTMLTLPILRLHRPQRLYYSELGAEGTRELMLDANKIEQLLKYRKASFPKSVSTTFVTHCSFAQAWAHQEIEWPKLYVEGSNIFISVVKRCIGTSVFHLLKFIHAVTTFYTPMHTIWVTTWTTTNITATVAASAIRPGTFLEVSAPLCYYYFHYHQ